VWMGGCVLVGGFWGGWRRGGGRGGVPLGWNIGVWNVILGGRWGYSGGKVRWAR